MNLSQLKITLVAAAIAAPSVAFCDVNPLEVMKRNFISSKVADSSSQATFRLINESGQERVRETDSMTKLLPKSMDNRRFVRFNLPSDVKNTKTLMIEHSDGDDDIWIFLPAMKKVRRLVASNKKDSFVGTDYSYGDVIGHKVESWKYKLLKEEPVDGKPCYVIEAMPKDKDVADTSGYSKRVLWVDKESFVALKTECYDQGGALIKRMTAKKLVKVDPKTNKWQAMTLEAENVQTHHKTVIEFKNFKANVGVSDDVFTSRSLERQ